MDKILSLREGDMEVDVQSDGGKENSVWFGILGKVEQRDGD